MKGRFEKKFGRYWTVGGFVGLVVGLVNLLGTTFLKYMAENLFKFAMQSLVNQIIFAVMTIAVFIAIFIIVPWLYGRVVEYAHNVFMTENEI